MRTPDTLFQVSLATIESMFAQAGRGFYVPPYQRQYGWGKDEVDRLAEDLCIGLQAWVDDPDVVTFLGSVILIKDELFDQVEPAIKEHLPSEVMVVIDGQQRLSTLSILGIILHGEVLRRTEKLRKKSFPGDTWLNNRSEATAARLLPLFELDVGFGDKRYYPKVIRAYIDQWSRDPESVEYASPIAQFLSDYIDRHRGQTPTHKHPEEPDDNGRKTVADVVRYLKVHIRGIAAGETNEGEQIFLSSQPFDGKPRLHLFKDHLPTDLLTHLAGDEGGPVRELLVLIILSNYLLSRCSVTLTLPTEDKFAFDMFERLNTTGQQLTAYETFRPLVVKTEGLRTYRDSEAHKWIQTIDSFVPADWNYEKRAKTTNDLLLPFAMAEEGKRLAKRLGQQRNWLRKRFESLAQGDAQRGFVRELRNLVLFLDECWHYDSDISANTRLPRLDIPAHGLVLLCLDYLKRVKNEICIGPLGRYYSRVIENPNSDTRRDFSDAVLGSAAFFTLYRWAFGTSKLPEVYTRLMRSGDALISALGRAGSKDPFPSGRDYQAYLGRELFRRISEGRAGPITVEDGKATWISTAKGKAIYQSSTVSRFALFAALHDTIEDSGAVGAALNRRGKDGSLDFLTLARWCEQPEVEHIAPQRKSAGWKDDLYEGEVKDLIGNLVLLPKVINISANNRSWDQKRLYYRVLSSPEDVGKYLDSRDVTDLNVDLSAITPDTLKLLGQARYDAHLAPIANVTEIWSRAIVEARSERLAELAWDRLAGWLQL